MLTIDRLSTRYRIAGRPARQTAVSRRLDRLARSALAQALEPLAQDFPAPDGPYLVIRKLDLALWLDPGGMTDPSIARLWAEALAAALHRALAEGAGDSVARYDDRAAFLADWLADHARDTAARDWRYAEFAVLDSLETGQAMTTALGREPVLIGPVLARLQRDHRLAGLIRKLAPRHIQALWRAWTGEEPTPGHTVQPLPATLAACRPGLPLSDPADPRDRARHALAWLVLLTAPPIGLPPERAGPLAMQIVHATSLARSLPDLAAHLSPGAALGPLRQLLQAAPPELRPAADWLGQSLGPATQGRLAALVALARPSGGGPRPAALPLAPVQRSAFAGLGLLLPAIRDLRLDDRLGARGRAALLCAAIPRRLRPLALADPAIQALAGRDDPGAGRPAIDWPAAPDLSAPSRPIADDAPSHGDGPEMPALRAVLDRFATGLRALPGASADYLARQFFLQPGEIEHCPREVVLRLGQVPLRLLLLMGGRTGPQGPIPWLDSRTLVVEVAHA